MISHFVANSEKCRKYTFLGGSTQIITISHGGVIEIYYNITWGGSSRFITILQWGGVSRDPKFVLRNIWTAPYERVILLKIEDWGCGYDVRILFRMYLLILSIYYFWPKRRLHSNS